MEGWERLLNNPAALFATVVGFFIYTAPVWIAIFAVEWLWTHRRKECPHCAERIKRKAKKCRYCGSTV